MNNIKLLKSYYKSLSTKGKLIFLLAGLVLAIIAIELIK